MSDGTRVSDGRECCAYRECQEPAHYGTKVPLCWNHLLNAWKDVQQELGRQLAERGSTKDRPADTGDRIPQVYFIRFRDRVKIGFTTNLSRRLLHIPCEEVLLTIPGTVEDEQRYHAIFAHLREQGEWFRFDSDLADFIADRKARDDRLKGRLAS